MLKEEFRGIPLFLPSNEVLSPFLSISKISSAAGAA